MATPPRASGSGGALAPAANLCACVPRAQQNAPAIKLLRAESRSIRRAEPPRLGTVRFAPNLVQTVELADVRNSRTRAALPQEQRRNRCAGPIKSGPDSAYWIASKPPEDPD